MNAQLSRLRTLVLKDLDPAYYQMDEQQLNNWHKEIILIEAHVLSVLQAEVFSDMDNSLVERHLKQVHFDCTFLLDALYKYGSLPELSDELYRVTEACLQQILLHIEVRYGGCLMLKKDMKHGMPENDTRIRVLLSADGLAYFFKLLNKAGALDVGTLPKMMVAISKNFTSCGIGNGSLSTYSLMTKYKQVVQRTATSVRALLVKMLKQLDDEFTVI